MLNTTDKVTFKGNPVRMEGAVVNVGDKAPDFTVIRPPFGSASLSDLKGKTVLISVVPSVDTGICDAQLRRLNKEASELSENVVVWNLSVDLPFALSRFCSNAGIDRAEALSDHKDRDFAQKYGMYMGNLGLLARSLWIIDASGVVRYKEVVPEMTTHPDYDSALKALHDIAG